MTDKMKDSADDLGSINTVVVIVLARVMLTSYATISDYFKVVK